MTPAERTYTVELIAARNLAISAKSHELLGEPDIAAVLRLASQRAIRRAEAAFPPTVAREIIVSGGLDKIDDTELRPIAPRPERLTFKATIRVAAEFIASVFAVAKSAPQSWN
jgi:hypothetical protein